MCIFIQIQSEKTQKEEAYTAKLKERLAKAKSRVSKLQTQVDEASRHLEDTYSSKSSDLTSDREHRYITSFHFLIYIKSFKKVIKEDKIVAFVMSIQITTVKS